MGTFYTVKDKQLLNDRNTLFKEVGIPAILRNGFTVAPFKGSWHGEYDKSIKGFIYEFSRLTNNNHLERIDVYIINAERWIQIYLNIFKLALQLNSVLDLKELEGIKFGIPPNSLSKMRLRCDEYKGPPLFYMLFLPEHKVGFFYTKSGYEAALVRLKRLIALDMENIDDFVKSWHQLQKPNVRDWEGNPAIAGAM